LLNVFDKLLNNFLFLSDFSILNGKFLREDLCIFLCLGKSGETTFEATDLRINKLAVVGQELDVVIDEIKIVLGCGEVLSLVNELEVTRIVLN